MSHKKITKKNHHRQHKFSTSISVTEQICVIRNEMSCNINHRKLYMQLPLSLSLHLFKETKKYMHVTSVCGPLLTIVLHAVTVKIIQFRTFFSIHSVIWNFFFYLRSLRSQINHLKFFGIICGWFSYFIQIYTMKKSLKL